MTKKLIKILLLTIFVLTTGCSVMSTPDVAFKSLSITDVGSQSVKADCVLTITNKNIYDLKIINYNYNFNIVDVPVSTSQSDVELILPSKVPMEVTLPIEMAYLDFITVLKKKPDLDKVPYHLTGNLKLGTPVGKVNYPLDKKGTLKVPDKYRPSYYTNMIKDFFK